jgi:starch synthase
MKEVPAMSTIPSLPFRSPTLLQGRTLSVLHVSSLMNPFSPGSGVADVVRELPCALARLGSRQSVILPRYRETDLSGFDIGPAERIDIDLGGGRSTQVSIYGTSVEAGGGAESRVRVLLVEHPLFDKIHTRGVDPTFGRYALLARSAIAAASISGEVPQIIHGHGRAGAMVPMFLGEAAARGFRLGEVGFVFSLHGRSDQGRFERGALDEFPAPPGFDLLLENSGKVDILKAAAVLADRIVVPSRDHLKEIVTPQFGGGLEGIYARRLAEGTLAGIPNGVGGEWNPATDRLIENNFSASDIWGKEANRMALKIEQGLSPDPRVPTMLVYARLTYSKGIPRIDEAMGSIMELGADLLVMGDAGGEMARMVEGWQKRFPRVKVHTRHDAKMAHRFLAGADILIHPSERETDALIPKMAVLYGLIPVVTPRGGMPDTASGVGFVTEDMTPGALARAVGEAVRAWHDPDERRGRLLAGMSRRFDWESSALEYMRIYEGLLRGARSYSTSTPLHSERGVGPRLLKAGLRPDDLNIAMYSTGQGVSGKSIAFDLDGTLIDTWTLHRTDGAIVQRIQTKPGTEAFLMGLAVNNRLLLYTSCSSPRLARIFEAFPALASVFLGEGRSEGGGFTERVIEGSPNVFCLDNMVAALARLAESTGGRAAAGGAAEGILGLMAENRQSPGRLIHIKSRLLASMMGKTPFELLIDDSDKVAGIARRLDEGFGLVKIPFRGDAASEGELRGRSDDLMVRAAEAIAGGIPVEIAAAGLRHIAGGGASSIIVVPEDVISSRVDEIARTVLELKTP